MAKILCRTNGNGDPKGKPRVYFTCHPADFEKHFERVCKDIFATHDCAVYYTEDMSEAIGEQDKTTDLESNNLFVVPVTFQLLTKPNRTMELDIPFALEKYIPVLPLMMEPGLDEIYSLPDKFGELQYLTPDSTDRTAVPYGEKLKKFLESVLISDEMAKRIRAAFDAYIFLSYRKKDRRYANALMRLIHSHPECRDIAIWYDEFLTPGESFRKNIEKILGNSKLFALLVTPNLLEEPDGKPNFVMGEEYPAACRSGIEILPAEMEDTDKTALQEKFANLPPCLDPRNDVFKARLMESVVKIATAETEGDPTHNFLIGLAYWGGIDVETDRDRGLALITAAGEAGLPEAMKHLYQMYYDGAGVAVNYRESAKWAERLAEAYKRLYGDEHPATMGVLHNLAHVYGKMGAYKKALELQERVYAVVRRLRGEEHPDTLVALNNLAVTYGELGEYKNALEAQETAYSLRCRVKGETDPETLNSLNNCALLYMELGNCQKALALQEKSYALECKVLGENHPSVLTSLSNLAITYNELRAHTKALDLQKKAYSNLCNVLGKEHPDTLTVLHNLAYAYGKAGNGKKELELLKQVYVIRCNLLGHTHPDTLTTLNNLAFSYGESGDYKKMRDIGEKAYALWKELLGGEHHATLTALHNLAYAYGQLGDHKKALELKEKVYAALCKVLGKEHPDTIAALHNLAHTYGKLREYKKAMELLEAVYALQRKVLGHTHPDTLSTLNNLAVSYGRLGDVEKSRVLMDQWTALSRKNQN